MTDFDYVYKKYFKDVYKFLLSMGATTDIAEEITQETFFKAMKNIERFDGKVGLKVWLCQIAKNTYFTLYSKEKKKIEKHEKHFEKQEAETLNQTIEEQLISKETTLAIHKCIHLLEEPYKEVFYMRFFGELSFLNIGHIFGKSESWARVTFHRAKLKIREELK